MGICAKWTEAETAAPGGPLVVMVAPPEDYLNMRRETVSASAMDLRARLVFFNKCHESMAGTGSMCTAAASRIAGSVVHAALGVWPEGSETLRIGHPLGIMSVRVKTRPSTAVGGVDFEALGFGRTARHIMDGAVSCRVRYSHDPESVAAEGASDPAKFLELK